MTKDDQQFILQNFAQHLADNKGSKITDALAFGLMSIMTTLTEQRLVEEKEEAPKE